MHYFLIYYYFSFLAYATPENKIKHEVIIAHRAYLIEQGIVEEDDVTVPNISIVPQLAHVSTFLFENVICERIPLSEIGILRCGTLLLFILY